MKHATRTKFLANKGSYIAKDGTKQQWADVPALVDSMHGNLNAIAICAVVSVAVSIFALLA